MRELVVSTVAFVMSVFLVSPLWAQGSDLDSELDRIYKDAGLEQGQDKKEVAKVNVKTAEAKSASAQPAGGEELVSSQPIYIVNQNKGEAAASNKNAQVQVHEQPTTYIQASPLTESRAERLRKSRLDAEAQTESRLVERLEQSRIEDEKRRAQALFGDSFNAMSKSQQAVVAQPVVQQATPVVVAAPTAAQDALSIREEIRAAIYDLEGQKKSNSFYEQRFFGGSVGFSDYPDASNINSNVSAGFSVGTKFDDRMVAEMSFLYGNYDVEDVFRGTVNGLPFIKSMDQYSVGGIFKYQLLTGKLRPAVGGVASYSYRSYSDTQYYLNVDDDTSSHALDMGITGSVDLALSSRLTLSGEYRYLWNVWHKTSETYNSYQNSYVNNSAYNRGKPLEEFSRYVFLLSAKLSF